MEFTKEQQAKRSAAMKEYFTKGELIVINEALFKYQYDCLGRANGMSNQTGLNTELIAKLKNISTVASELREEFEPFDLPETNSGVRYYQDGEKVVEVAHA